jgi:hypothetical protein
MTKYSDFVSQVYGWPYNGPSIGGQFAAAFVLLLPVVILALVFSYPLAW